MWLNQLEVTVRDGVAEQGVVVLFNLVSPQMAYTDATSTDVAHGRPSKVNAFP